MTTIERNGNEFVVPAELLADAFGLSEAAVRQAMRANRITSLSETGVGEDAGRWRLTFYFEDRAVRYTVDENGRVLKRASFPSLRKNKPGQADRRGPDSE